VGTDAIAGAPLDGHPPVVVLMPGLGQPVAAYSALAEDLASHGYAVVGINPTGSTSVVEFPDGHLVPGSPAGVIDPALMADIPGWYAAATRITTVWVADMAFVAASLAADTPAMGALDFSRVAYVGHSLGGAAAFQACAQDVRCSAAVDLDGTLWTEVRHTGLRAPSLLLRADPADPCDAFCEAAAADFAAVEAMGPSEELAIAGSRHLDFTDLGLLSPVPGVLDLGSIGAGRMTTITRDLVGSFLDVHVRGAAEGTFATATARYDELR
jgi:dienelactone hydrolase